ncbi:unnamed protein product, partial [Ectocarpus fasciculatus]
FSFACVYCTGQTNGGNVNLYRLRKKACTAGGTIRQGHISNSQLMERSAKQNPTFKPYNASATNTAQDLQPLSRTFRHRIRCGDRLRSWYFSAYRTIGVIDSSPRICPGGQQLHREKRKKVECSTRLRH